jgi:hypothetical protein
VKFIFVLFVLFCSFSVFSQTDFEKYFNANTLRFDYYRTCNSDTFYISLGQLKEEPFWGGPKKNLLDTFNLGECRFLVYSKKRNVLIYSRNYSALSLEWMATDEARKISRSFYESIIMPFPRDTVILKLQTRDKNLKFVTVFEYEIDPLNKDIIKENLKKCKIEKILYSGDPSKKIDIAVIPEGYTLGEMDKFNTDLKRFIDYFFTVSPFTEKKNKFNYWAIYAPSEESEADFPDKGIWKNTLLDAHFNTFNKDRFLTTYEIWHMRDLAANVPYDQVFILVNSSTYGGGGIFNFYNICTSSNQYSEEIFVHEFGHAFAALGDEYEEDSFQANQLYNMLVEPWQMNLTNLIDFNSKWKSMVDKETPIPTPDIANYKYKIGVFEGAGYVKKGIYRPWSDCIMRSITAKRFCPVCLKAIRQMIDFYAQ